MTEDKYNTKDIRHIDEKSQEYIAKGNRMTEEIIINEKSLQAVLKRYDELEQENRELKAYKDVNEDFKKAWDELNKKYTEVLKLAKTNADSNEYCLQELEKENKELKALNKKICEDWSKEIKVYWAALEEIREMCNKHLDAKEICYATQVIDKIDEVLGNEI